MAMKRIPNVFLKVPHYNCFGCSPANGCGLQLEFFGADDGEVTTETVISDHHAGFPTVCHGGVSMAILDELAFWAAFYVTNRFGFTTSMSFKLRKPVPVGEPVIASARVISRSGRLIKMNAVIRRKGQAEDLIVGEITYFLADEKTWEKVTGQPVHESVRQYVL
jgi:acyl-coenzyme A thioesterase PaaI-like protein